MAFSLGRPQGGDDGDHTLDYREVGRGRKRRYDTASGRREPADVGISRLTPAARRGATALSGN